MPSDLPTGTVTFLCSDIEGSTRLLQRLGPDYARVLGEHQALLRAAWAANGGVEVDTQGDSFFVAFPSAPAAVAAATQATHVLAEHAWPEGDAVRVRIGLHTGTPQLVGGRYVGMDVHRAARIAAAGHGGQVLLSEATRVLAEHNLPDGATLRDLGAHRLKDLQHAEHLYQVVLPGLPADFPSLKTLDARPHNLPVQPTPLLGREEVLAAVSALLRRGGARLVTLTGPGGIGKTRLAIQVAAEVLDDFPDGVWFVRLSRLSDPGLVPPTVAQALDVPEQGGKAIAETLRAHLRDRRLVLLLDNFEQVMGAAPEVGALLEASPGLKVLVTSRIRLHLRGEREYPLPPLPLPEPGGVTPPERMSQYGAVALFVERAREARPDFAVTAANAPAVAEICARLDGLPLAIELAAARVKVLPPEALLARLSGRLALLTGGARDLEERQRTMRAAIAWSEDPLSPDERTLFRRLAIFVGGCTLEAAEAVCAAPVGAEPLANDVLDGLTALVDHSLVQQREEGGEARFGMLHVIRDYAVEQLEASGEAEAVGWAHLAYYRGLGDRFYQAEISTWADAEMVPWFDRLGRELDNFRAAQAWARARAEEDRRAGGAVEPRDATAESERALEAGLHLAGTLLYFWVERGPSAEGRQWAEAFLGLDAPDAVASAGLEAPRGCGEGSENAPALSPASTEELAVRARAFYALGDLVDEAQHALAPLERSVALYRAAGDRKGMLGPLLSLGEVVASLGDRARAAEIFEEALALGREVYGPLGGMRPLDHLSELALAAGDLDLAQARSEEALTLALLGGNLLAQSRTLGTQALVACRRGQAERASALARKALELHLTLRHAIVSYNLELCAYVLAAAQRPARERAARAARLVGAAAAQRQQRERLGARRWSTGTLTPDEIEVGVATARAALGEKRWAAEVAAGRALSPEQAIAEALQISPRSAELPAAFGQIVNRRK